MRQNETKRQKDRSAARDLGIEIGEKRSESTSIKTSPATRFALQWINAVSGMGAGDAYAHAIAVFAEELEHNGHKWSDAYHPHESVRWLRMFLIGLANKEDQLEQLKYSLVSAHRPFFFRKDKGKWVVDEQRAYALWPHMIALVSHWDKRREFDAWATGEKMAEILRDAKITPPAWGPAAEVER
jgi:hypothetical protein